MAEYVVYSEDLVAVADAIRAKHESTELFTFPTGYVEAINNITGGDMNVVIIGSTTEPVNPINNTIWVNTNTEISVWAFSALEPINPVEGTVWIKTGISSSVEFNALSENIMVVYPISVKQFISGAWVDKIAQSYQNGKWVDWILYLYKDGVINELLGNANKIFSNYGYATLVYNTDNIFLNCAGGNGVFAFENKIDFTGKSKLCFEYKATISGPSEGRFHVFSTYSTSSFHEGAIVGRCTEDDAIHTMILDISALDSGYIGFSGTFPYAENIIYLTIYKIWLE